MKARLLLLVLIASATPGWSAEDPCAGDSTCALKVASLEAFLSAAGDNTDRHNLPDHFVTLLGPYFPGQNLASVRFAYSAFLDTLDGGDLRGAVDCSVLYLSHADFSENLRLGVVKRPWRFLLHELYHTVQCQDRDFFLAEWAAQAENSYLAGPGFDFEAVHAAMPLEAEAIQFGDDTYQTLLECCLDGDHRLVSPFEITGMSASRQVSRELTPVDFEALTAGNGNSTLHYRWVVAPVGGRIIATSLNEPTMTWTPLEPGWHNVSVTVAFDDNQSSAQTYDQDVLVHPMAVSLERPELLIVGEDHDISVVRVGGPGPAPRTRYHLKSPGENIFTSFGEQSTQVGGNLTWTPRSPGVHQLRVRLVWEGYATITRVFNLSVWQDVSAALEAYTPDTLPEDIGIDPGRRIDIRDAVSTGTNTASRTEADTTAADSTAADATAADATAADSAAKAPPRNRRPMTISVIDPEGPDGPGDEDPVEQAGVPADSDADEFTPTGPDGAQPRKKPRKPISLFTAPRLSSVRRDSAEEYTLLGRNLGHEKWAVEVLENGIRIDPSRISRVSNEGIVVISTHKGFMRHQVIVEGNATNEVTFLH